MNFGNDWTTVMIVHKAREKDLLNQAENDRRVKELQNEEEPRHRWKLRINNDRNR